MNIAICGKLKVKCQAEVCRSQVRPSDADLNPVQSSTVRHGDVHNDTLREVNCNNIPLNDVVLSMINYRILLVWQTTWPFWYGKIQYIGLTNYYITLLVWQTLVLLDMTNYRTLFGMTKYNTLLVWQKLYDPFGMISLINANYRTHLVWQVHYTFGMTKTTWPFWYDKLLKSFSITKYNTLLIWQNKEPFGMTKHYITLLVWQL